MAPDYYNFHISNTAPPGGEATIQQVIALIHWFIDRLEVANDTISFNFLGIPDAEFRALGDAAPIFNTIQQDFLGFKHVLTLVSTATLLHRNNTNSVITKMTESLGDDDRKTALFQHLYQRIARTATNYWDDLRAFAAHVLHHVIFMETKIFLALRLAESCETFIRNVDPLAGNLYLLDIGEMTLDQAKGHNTIGMGSKQTLQTAYNAFWEARNPPPRTGTWNLDDLHRVFPGLQVAANLTVRDIRTHQAAGTLHNWMVNNPPITFERWEDVSDTIKSLETSFLQLRSYKADAQIELRKKAAAIRISVLAMATEVTRLDDLENLPSVIELEIISSDIQHIYQTLVSLETQGLAWDLDTFGVSRQQIKEWRHKTATRLEQGQTLKKKKAKEEEVASEQFSAAAREAPWAKITRDSWRNWLARWIRSSKSMTSEAVKINIIKKCLTDKDRLDIENLNTSEKMMELICLRYGGLQE